MKNRCVLASAAVIAAAAGMAQGQQIVESFNDINTLVPGGWSLQNLADIPLAGDAFGWFQGNPAVWPGNSGPTGAEYAAANWARTQGTLCNSWMILPTRTLTNGDTLEFYARANDGTYPDRLQVRMSTNGASTNAGPGGGSIDPGDFTNLLLDINPNYQPGVFLNSWTLYTVTVSGLSGPTNGRLAFRYFVENGGPTGVNSDFVGVDDVTYTPAGGVVTGACCLSAGNCVVATSASCSAQGGVYQGDNSPCGTCPQPGRCCFLDGSCQLLQPGACTAAGGTFGGAGTSCGTCPQPTCFEATGLGVAITSTTTPGTQGPVGTGNLVVSASQTITSMFAKVRAAHTWQGDARIELKHPDGTTIDLVFRPGVAPPKATNNTATGFSTDNFGNPGTGAYMTFIDSASGVYDNAVGFPGPPAGTAVATNNPVGPYRAHGGSLNSTFGGKNVNGTWQVLGSDYWTGDEGSIDAVAVCLPAAATGPACYANCDNSTNQPCLNVQDFGCFLNAFAAGSSYANCDNSTSAPVLNVQDFGCFLNAFAAGCSSCV